MYFITKQQQTEYSDNQNHSWDRLNRDFKEFASLLPRFADASHYFTIPLLGGMTPLSLLLAAHLLHNAIGTPYKQLACQG